MKTATTEIKHDPLHNKMDAYVIDHIEKFIAPELRHNPDAIRLAREWNKVGLPIYEINSRLAVLEEEANQTHEAMMEELAEAIRAETEEEMERDGFGPATGVNGTHKMEQAEQMDNTIANDLHYLHF